MNKFNLAAIIQDYLSGTDQVLFKDQLIALAKKIRPAMGDWDIYLGYVLLGIFGIRFTLPRLGQMKFQNPTAKNLSFREKFHKWTYLAFYVYDLISLLTGLIIKLAPKELKKSNGRNSPFGHLQFSSIYYRRITLNFK